MSTKIYDAYIFNGTSEKLMVQLKKIKQQYASYVENELKYSCKLSLLSLCDYDETLFNKFLVKTHSSELTKDTLLGSLPPFYVTYLLEILKESRRNTAINFECTAAVFYYKKLIIVQFFGLPSKILNSIDSMKEKDVNLFSDFHYQNQVDAYFDDADYRVKHNITAIKLKELRKNWTFRKNVWNKIYDTTWTPIDAGLTFEFFTNSAIFSIVDSFKDAIKNIDFSIIQNKQDYNFVYEKIIDASETDKALDESILYTELNEIYDECLVVYYHPNVKVETMSTLAGIAEKHKISLTFKTLLESENIKKKSKREHGSNIGSIKSWAESFKKRHKITTE